MELRHLRYFLAVADALHFTRAAEALEVSQPTPLGPDQGAGARAGCALFDRAGRSVRLTSAGAAFRGHAFRALREVEMGREAVADLLGLRAGTLRVGVTHSFSTALIPRAVARFRRDYPEVSVIVEKQSGRAVEQGLVSGTLDLGIAFAPPEDPEVAADTLFEEEIVLIVSGAHPMADRASVRLAELDGLTMVLHGQRVRDPPPARRPDARGGHPAPDRGRDERHRLAAGGRAPRDRGDGPVAPGGQRPARPGAGADHRADDEPDRRAALAPRLAPGRRLARLRRGRARGLPVGLAGRSAGGQGREETPLDLVGMLPRSRDGEGRWHDESPSVAEHHGPITPAATPASRRSCRPGPAR